MNSFTALCFSDLGLGSGSRGPCGSWKLHLNTQNGVPGVPGVMCYIQVPSGFATQLERQQEVLCPLLLPNHSSGQAGHAGVSRISGL